MTILHHIPAPHHGPDSADIIRLHIPSCSGTTLATYPREYCGTRFVLTRFNQLVAEVSILDTELLTTPHHQRYAPYLRALSELSSALTAFSRTEICHE